MKLIMSPNSSLITRRPPCLRRPRHPSLVLRSTDTPTTPHMEADRSHDAHSRYAAHRMFASSFCICTSLLLLRFCRNIRAGSARLE